jgi:hypothetical protein
MPASRLRRVLDALIDNTPWPSTIIGLVLVVVICLATATSTWPPLPQSTGPVPTVAITPDDPAAPTPVPARELEH